jgi:hypothetical protein
MPVQSVVIPSYQAQPEYQQAVAQLGRGVNDFKAQQDLEKSQYQGQFNQNARRLGYNQSQKKFDPTIPNSEYGLATRANTADFAGRGMTFSGENVRARDNIQNQFDTQITDLNRGQTDFLGTQAQSMRAYETQQEAVRQQAQMAAIATIAARFGIDLGQVPTGGSSTTIQQEVP